MELLPASFLVVFLPVSDTQRLDATAATASFTVCATISATLKMILFFFHIYAPVVIKLESNSPLNPSWICVFFIVIIIFLSLFLFPGVRCCPAARRLWVSIPSAWGLPCMVDLTCLPCQALSVWLLSGHSCFLPRSTNMHMRRSGSSE